MSGLENRVDEPPTIGNSASISYSINIKYKDTELFYRHRVGEEL